MTESILPSIFDVGFPVPPAVKDIVDYEYMAYENSNANVSDQTQYRLWSTDTQSHYYLPSAQLEVSFFTYQGALGSTGPTTPVLASQSTALASNGWSLFQDCKLRLNDLEVAQVMKPGKMCQILNLVEKGKNNIDTIGEMSHYFVDSVSDLGVTGTVFYRDAPAAGAGTTVTADGASGSTGEAYNPLGMYDEIQFARTVIGSGSTGSAVTSVRKNPDYDPAFKRKVDRAVAGIQKIFLPLKDIFPILELDRVVKGTKIEVELNKISNVAEALFGATTTSSINIVRVRLWLARLRPSLSALSRIESQIAANPLVTHTFDNVRLYTLPYNDTSIGDKIWQLTHKQSRPSKIYVGFQFMTRDSDVRLNPLQFDGLGTSGAMNISRIELRANGKAVPNVAYTPDTETSRILYDLYRMGSKDIEDSACITYKNWKSVYPIFGFDLSMQEGSPYETRSQTVLDLFWSLSTAAAAAYNVVAVVVSEGSALVDYSSGQTTIRTN